MAADRTAAPRPRRVVGVEPHSTAILQPSAAIPHPPGTVCLEPSTCGSRLQPADVGSSPTPALADMSATPAVFPRLQSVFGLPPGEVGGWTTASGCCRRTSTARTMTTRVPRKARCTPGTPARCRRPAAGWARLEARLDGYPAGARRVLVILQVRFRSPRRTSRLADAGTTWGPG